MFITLIICGCRNNQNVKPLNETVPTSTDFQKGESLFNSSTKQDSAFYYFTKVTENSKDSLLVAMSFTYMAMIQEDAGDYFGSQESALEALRHVNEKRTEYHYCLSSIYNELGATSAGLKNYDAAIEYYDLAVKFQQDDTYKTIFQNNKAIAYRDKGNYAKAIQILRGILEKLRGQKREYARVLTNLASIKWMADSSFYPVPQLREALNIRIAEKDEIGITVSYGHLSDYYFSHHADSALLYAKNMYALAQKISSVDKKIDALRKLITLAPAEASKKYFRQYRVLEDSILTSRNEAKNQFALIRYQAEKSKLENLLLQQDNAKKELKILRQEIWIYIIAILAVVAIFFIFWRYQKKRKKLKWENERAIQENHLKTSQKVHDIVANGLYRIMKDVEHNEVFEKDILLDKIEYLYERSRDISYEPIGKERNTKEIINEMLASFGTSQVKILITGNQQKIWDIVSPPVAKEIGHVLEELMINMAKHSKAKHVVVRFDLFDDQLTIFYKDDGIGFSPGFTYGNGLRSTENRIKGINGKLIFAKELGDGASMKTIIPISKT